MMIAFSVGASATCEQGRTGRVPVKSIPRSGSPMMGYNEPFGVRICLEFLVVFGATLQGYYFYSVNVAPFPLLGFGILLVLCLHAGTRVLDRDSFYLIHWGQALSSQHSASEAKSIGEI
jgi:hypothetical protein